MMTKYTVSKTVLARPMTRQEYNDFRGWLLPPDEDGDDEGFLVEDINGKPNVTGYNGYISWLPADEFKRTCKPKQAAPVPVKTLHNSDVSGARKNVKDKEAFAHAEKCRSEGVPCKLKGCEFYDDSQEQCCGGALGDETPLVSVCKKYEPEKVPRGTSRARRFRAT